MSPWGLVTMSYGLIKNKGRYLAVSTPSKRRQWAESLRAAFRDWAGGPGLGAGSGCSLFTEFWPSSSPSSSGISDRDVSNRTESSYQLHRFNLARNAIYTGNYGFKPYEADTDRSGACGVSKRAYERERGFHRAFSCASHPLDTAWQLVGWIILRAMPASASRWVKWSWPYSHPLNIAWMSENIPHAPNYAAHQRIQKLLRPALQSLKAVQIVEWEVTESHPDWVRATVVSFLVTIPSVEGLRLTELLHSDIWIPLQDHGVELREVAVPCHANTLAELVCPAYYEGTWCFGTHSIARVSQLRRLESLEMTMNSDSMGTGPLKEMPRRLAKISPADVKPCSRTQTIQWEIDETVKSFGAADQSPEVVRLIESHYQRSKLYGNEHLY
ncbi:hypothetical protein B0H13DRAFT_2284992 [Mycena leptocephala]|nr:hypothetical protein B0H13DRAFT_2284992 [Mycena leptocephala]